MSAERLREAASLLRERAEAATPGPWRTGGESGLVWDTALPEIGPTKIVCDSREGDATYIATMSPPVALALADLLDDDAEAAQWSNGDLRESIPLILALVDAILGDA